MHRHRENEVDVVDRGLGEDRRIAPRGLDALLRLAEHVGHFGASIGGFNCGLVDARPQRARSAEADG